MRPTEFLVEVTVSVDHSEVDTPLKVSKKRQEIKRAIEELDPAIGIFEVGQIE